MPQRNGFAADLKESLPQMNSVSWIGDSVCAKTCSIRDVTSGQRRKATQWVQMPATAAQDEPEEL
jgi:hypothetical protein